MLIFLILRPLGAYLEEFLLVPHESYYVWWYLYIMYIQNMFYYVFGQSLKNILFLIELYIYTIIWSNNNN